LEEGEESAPGINEANQEGGLHTIDLSSDEDVGLEADLEEEELWPHDLDNMEKSRAEKLKRSSLKKVKTTDRCLDSQVFSQTGVIVFLSAGGQSKEGILQTEHREKDDQNWNKDCFCGTKREDQTENFQPEGFTADIQHQEGTDTSALT